MIATCINPVTDDRTYAERIDESVAVVEDALRDSFELGHSSCLNDLFDLWHDCKRPDWDGHGALPVGEAEFDAACRFVNALPIGFERPSVGAEPDGQITLEWYRTRHRLVSVSVDPAGVLHYAALFGINPQSGRIAFFAGETPLELIELVKRLNRA
jgi:hypothetical protein